MDIDDDLLLCSSLPNDEHLVNMVIVPPEMSSPHPIFLMDGGLGTTLADQYDFLFDHRTPLWSSNLLLTPQDQTTLQECQTQFARAGASVILTATYQISEKELIASGLNQQQSQQVMRDAVKIARASFEGRPGQVVLGLGAYGAIMKPSQEYTGKYEKFSSVAALRAFHGARLNAFLPMRIPLIGSEAEVEVIEDRQRCWNELDLIAFETVPRVEEITAVRDAMGDAEHHLLLNFDTAPEWRKKFWISCVFPDDTGVLPDGSTTEQVVTAILGTRLGAPRPFGIGINCTKVARLEPLIVGYEAAIRKLIETKELNEWPSLILYPDGTTGEVYNTTTQTWEMATTYTQHTHSWDEIVCNIVKKTQARGPWQSIYVGGCCKATPCDIAKLRVRLDQEVLSTKSPVKGVETS